MREVLAAADGAGEGAGGAGAGSGAVDRVRLEPRGVAVLTEPGA